MKIHHLNCGLLHKPPSPKASCHCLLLEFPDKLILVDTGIGLLDVEHPESRLSKETIEAAGFQFHEELTAARQLEALGIHQEDVTDIILSHMDNDHTGGAADFPNAVIHVSEEEYNEFYKSDSPRYSKEHFEHDPTFQLYDSSIERSWFAFEARAVNIPGPTEILLIPLFGHTAGHCGVAISYKNKWIFYIGDAYYLRAELEIENHPVDALASMAAWDDTLRRESLGKLRNLYHNHGDQIEIHGYHDLTELPTGN